MLRKNKNMKYENTAKLYSSVTYIGGRYVLEGIKFLITFVWYIYIRHNVNEFN